MPVCDQAKTPNGAIERQAYRLVTKLDDSLSVMGAPYSPRTVV
jgi:hypothetical protein